MPLSTKQYSTKSQYYCTTFGMFCKLFLIKNYKNIIKKCAAEATHEKRIAPTIVATQSFAHNTSMQKERMHFYLIKMVNYTHLCYKNIKLYVAILLYHKGNGFTSVFYKCK